MSVWNVWVGGVEADTYFYSLDKAQFVAESWKRLGYDDVVIEEVVKW
jgi:hypothetical protein